MTLGNTFAINNGYHFTGESHISSGDSAYFNGFGLGNTNYRTELDGDGNPETRYTEFPKPRSDGDIFGSRFFGGRKFVCNLIIFTENCEDFRDLELKAKKAILNAENKYFIRKRYGVYEKILCTCTGFNQNNEINENNSKSYTLTFDCTNEFWSLLDDSSRGYAITSFPHVEEITHDGGGEKSMPLIYVVFNSGTALDNFSINIDDLEGPNNFTFTYPSSLVPNDILKIDCKNYIFEKNGTEGYDFTGTYPELTTKPNTITFGGTGTVDCSVTFIYPTNNH